MSDDMRIYGRQGQGRQGDPRERRGEALKRFKRGHQPGDMVEGVFLRLEPAAPGTAWVSLEGAALLAALPEDLAAVAKRIAAGSGVGARPTGISEADFPISTGQLCYFILEKLEPEPVLRMLRVTKTPGVADPEADTALLHEQRQALWRNTIRLPLTVLAARYLQSRAALEKLLRRNLWTAEDLRLGFPHELPEHLQNFAASFDDVDIDEGSARSRYLRYIGSAGEARQAFGEFELYRAALVENLQPHGLLAFSYLPWLYPGGSSVELAFYRLGGGQATPGGQPASSPALLPKGDVSTLPERGAPLDGIAYRLQAGVEAEGRLTRRELFGVMGKERATLRELGPGEPDLLQTVLSFWPEERRGTFRRKA